MPILAKGGHYKGPFTHGLAQNQVFTLRVTIGGHGGDQVQNCGFEHVQHQQLILCFGVTKLLQAFALVETSRSALGKFSSFKQGLW